MERRIRYNRASIEDALQAALEVVSDKPLYVFAVYGGYTIEKHPPDLMNQSYYRVMPDHWVTQYEYQGAWVPLAERYIVKELGKPTLC